MRFLKQIGERGEEMLVCDAPVEILREALYIAAEERDNARKNDDECDFDTSANDELPCSGAQEGHPCVECIAQKWMAEGDKRLKELAELKKIKRKRSVLNETNRNGKSDS